MREWTVVIERATLPYYGMVGGLLALGAHSVRCWMTRKPRHLVLAAVLAPALFYGLSRHIGRFTAATFKDGSVELRYPFPDRNQVRKPSEFTVGAIRSAGPGGGYQLVLKTRRIDDRLVSTKSSSEEPLREICRRMKEKAGMKFSCSDPGRD